MAKQVQERLLQDMRYAIGTDPNNLSELNRMKVPWPDQIVFQPASSYYMRGDGTRVGDGYASATWIWDVISLQKLSYLLEYLNGEDWVRVYMRTDRRDGTYPNPRTAFAVYYGIMLKPILSGSEGVPLARSPYALQTVSITFKNLLIQTSYL